MPRTPAPPAPALAFYLQHAKDFDALCQLDEPPKGVEARDWQKFLDVVDKASEQGAKIVIACRDGAVEAFSARFNPGEKTRPATAKQDWVAYGQLREKKPKTLKSFYVGCGLSHDPAGRVFLWPYVYAHRSARTELLDRVNAARLSWALPKADWLTDCVPLALIPIEPKSDLGEVTAACGKHFVELARYF